MENSFRPQLKTVIEEEGLNCKVFGRYTILGQELERLLFRQGFRTDESLGFDYVFIIGEYENIENILEKFQTNKTKFFLLIDKNLSVKEVKKAQIIFARNLKNQKINGKIVKYSPDETLKKELAENLLKNCFSNKEEKEEKEQRPEKRSRSFLFLLPFVLLFVPVLFFLINLFFGGWFLYQSYQGGLKGNFSYAELSAKTSEKNFSSAFFAFKIFERPFQLFGKEKNYKEYLSLLEASENLSLVANHLSLAAQNGELLVKSIFKEEEKNKTSELISKIKTNISLAEEELALIEAQNLQPVFFKTEFAKIKELRKKLSGLKNFIPGIPEILGITSPKNYLVLMQNNFELRPGGGFIGTLGFLSLNNGKAEFKIEDVYTIDGQLKGHVEPPPAIKNYLNQPHWYLRDANFDPDFKINGQKISWFLEKEIGAKADGVISIDLSLFKKILELTGPLTLKDYQDSINSENFFLKAQVNNSSDFFPGSTQKKDYLGAAAVALFEKLLEKEGKISSIGLARVLDKGLEEKHVQIYFDNPLLEKITINQDWGGSIKDNSAKKGINDYLMVVDANLGVNKVNYFIKRKIAKNLSLQENILTSKVTINYENSSPKGVEFGGDYKNYLRVLTEKDFTLIKTLIDGKEIKNIDFEEIGGKQSVGFLFDVPQSEKREVTLLYQKNIVDENMYSLLIQKQAGTDSDDLSIASNFGLGYNGNLLIDRAFEIRLSR